MNLRKQAKAIFVCCSKERSDFKMINSKNNVLTNDELAIVRNMHVHTYEMKIVDLCCLILKLRWKNTKES